MQLLIIGYVWPEPRSSAAGGHMMQIIEVFLHSGWQITFASPATPGEHKVDLLALGVLEQEIRLNHSSFDVFVSELQPDVVLFDRFLMEEQFGWRVEQYCPDALRVLETSDLHCLREVRHQEFKRVLALAQSTGATPEYQRWFERKPDSFCSTLAVSDIALREVAAIYRSDLSLIISQPERQLLISRFGVPAALLHYCPLMLRPCQGVQPGFGERQHFVTIGNFRHAPNWDAVLWLKQEIWPLIRARLPRAELHVYGSYTPPKAVALENPSQGFRVKGWAEDALLVMQSARLCLAPLRFGAGIKGKILDAMVSRTPVITTPIGAEGMLGSGEDGCWGGRITTTPDAFAAAAAELYQDEVAWREASKHGATVLAQCFDAEVHGRALLGAIDQALCQRDARRLLNFTGAMLRHHHHKSTQYMAQWIEEKHRRRDESLPG